MGSTVKFARRAGILIIGIPLFTVGIILIPLPGPGLLVCFLALLLLAQEFEWARKHADTARSALTAIYDKAKQRADNFEQKVDKKADSADTKNNKVHRP
ncbi:PGPGW domain-containing protein [Candidatus Saccharibacteria bacterium]|nr:PGPGW domain-containing protein [Candidatus Saccharibacteria bacterium]